MLSDWPHAIAVSGASSSSPSLALPAISSADIGEQRLPWWLHQEKDGSPWPALILLH